MKNKIVIVSGDKYPSLRDAIKKLGLKKSIFDTPERTLRKNGYTKFLNHEYLIFEKEDR